MAKAVTAHRWQTLGSHRPNPLWRWLLCGLLLLLFVVPSSESFSQRRRRRSTRKRKQRTKRKRRRYRRRPRSGARKRRTAYVWEDMSDGLFSTLATCVAVDPKEPQRVYAAANGILYLSTNGGLRWRPLVRFSGASRDSIQSVSLQARLRQIRDRLVEEKIEELAAEVGEQQAQERRGELEREAEEEAEDILRRRLRQQGGLNTANNRFRKTITRIIVSPTNTKIILVATSGGAYLSEDGGQRFRAVFRGRGGLAGDIRAAAIAPNNPKMMVLGTRQGLWISRNGGKLWQRARGRLRVLEVREVRFDPNKANTLYAATARGLFASKDAGKRFLEIFTIASGPVRITTMAVLPTKPTSIVVGTGMGLYIARRSRRFRPLQVPGIGSRGVLYITGVPNAPKRFHMITERGVFITRNYGRRFQQMRAGLVSQQVRFLSVSPHDPDEVWIATDYGLMRWSKLLSRKVTSAQFKKFQRRLRREPTSWRVTQAALTYMQLRLDLAGIQKRYRLRALLPELRVSGRMFLDRDSNYLLLRNSRNHLNILESRTMLLEVIAVWDLRSLIFDRGQSQVVTELRSLRRSRDRMMTRTIRLYHARRRLQFRLFTSPPKNLYRYMRLVLKLKELTSQIDGLTGGYFSRELKKAQRFRGVR